MKKFTLSIVFRFTDEKKMLEQVHYSCYCNTMQEGFALFEEKLNNIYRFDKVIIHNMIKIERVHFKPFKSVQINSINDRRKVHNLEPLEL